MARMTDTMTIMRPIENQTALYHEMDANQIAHLKFELILQGCRLSQKALQAVQACKPMIRARSGVSGGLDIILAPDVYVNCDINESRARRSPYLLDYAGGRFNLHDRTKKFIADISILPYPAYYDQSTRDGTPMVEIGQMCNADRICVGLSNQCVFWPKRTRCRFCSIGANVHCESAAKTVDNIVETVIAASQDPVLPARHVLLGGGTPPGEDRGAVFAAQISRVLKDQCDLSIYAMIAPPKDLKYIDHLYEAGVDEIGINVELFDPRYLRKYAPGKYNIGQSYYFAALERAVKVFGPINTRSIAIVGLEPASATLNGVKQLASMGVMPILSPFRALDGSDLSGFSEPNARECLDIYLKSVRICSRHHIPLGPTCIPCQNNVLAMPAGAAYRYY